MSLALDVVIPAAGPPSLLRDCLLALLAESKGLALRVIVVPNGPEAEDNHSIATGLGATAHQEVIVSAVPTGEWRGKPGALNRGDLLRRTDVPVLYLDADTVLLPGSLAALANRLHTVSSPLLAAPPMIVKPHAGWMERGFSEVWQRLPSVENDVAGCGAYAVNPAGRLRWTEFPPLSGDDCFVRSQFQRHEREVLREGGFLFQMPEGAELLRAKRRWDDGNRQVAREYGKKVEASKPGEVVLRFWRSPVSLACFLAVTLASKLLVRPPRTAYRWRPTGPRQIGATDRRY